jgi:hypothetical protein
LVFLLLPLSFSVDLLGLWFFPPIKLFGSFFSRALFLIAHFLLVFENDGTLWHQFMLLVFNHAGGKLLIAGDFLGYMRITEGFDKMFGEGDGDLYGL